MLRLFRSTSLRLALGYGALFVVFSLVLVGLLWWRTAGYLDREINAVIVADTQAIGDRLHDFGLAGALKTIDERIGQTADEHAIYLLADPSFTPIGGNLTDWPGEIDRDPGWHHVDLMRDGKRHATRILHVALPADFHLLVGRDVQDRLSIRNSIVGGLIWAAIAALGLAVVGGLLVRRLVLRRVELINRTAGAIMRGDLSRRLPVRATADEFDQLAQTINDMLRQIQRLIEGVRNTSNAVAHDLRTPLAEIRARLEELLRVRPSPEATFQEVQAAVGDIDRVIGIFGALLRLAEIDSGARLSGFRRVDLAEVVAGVAELYGPLAEEKSIAIEVAAPSGFVVDGDPYLLAQAVGNLVDNAIKYAPAHTAVSLALSAAGEGGIAICVADRGPGIPEAERSRVTDYFYRGEAAKGTAGVGLGLSLVSAVARLHGGTLDLADHAPGLIATLSLPAAGKPSA